MRVTGEGLPRRTVLGAAAAAIGAVAGCSAEGTARPRPAASGPHRARNTAVPERDLPGDADFWVASVGPAEAIEGYADQVSVRPGQDFTLHVSTTGSSFRVSAYRVGWYRGAQARLMWRSGEIRGRRQQEAVVRLRHPDRGHALGADADHAHRRLAGGRVPAPAGRQQRPPALRPDGRAVGGRRGQDRHRARRETWQAYNLWGGYSLYQGEDGSYGTRSLQVSFNRPYDGDGADKFMVYERAFVVLAERTGIPLAYTTGMDIERPIRADGATAIYTLGHDEYWTRSGARPSPGPRRRHQRGVPGREHLLPPDQARRGHGRRREPVGHLLQDRRRAGPDVLGRPGAGHHRLPAAAGPDPESSLTGVIYEGYPVDAPYVIHQPDHWLYAGTGVRKGQSFEHLVGVEFDRVNLGYPTPRPIEVLAHSPVVCEGQPDYSDTAYYTTSSGAGVFASGTMRWVESMMAGHRGDGADHHISAAAGRFVTR